MMFAVIFEILFCAIADMLMSAVIVLAIGALTPLTELTSYLATAGLVEGALTLVGRLVDVAHGLTVMGSYW